MKYTQARKSSSQKRRSNNFLCLLLSSLIFLSFVSATHAEESTGTPPTEETADVQPAADSQSPTQQEEESLEDFKARMGKMGTLKSDVVPINPQSEDKKLFYYEIAPGNTIEDELLLANLAEEENLVEIVPVYARTNEKGEPEYSLKEDEQKELGTWITLGEQEITLKPNEKKKISIKLTVPPETPYGTYNGGFALQRTFEHAPGESFGSVFRKIIKIEVNVTETPKEFIKKTTPIIQITIYFWIALALFALSLAYYFFSNKRKTKRS